MIKIGLRQYILIFYYLLCHNARMKRLVLFCVFLIGCVPADSKSCEFCGKWSFDRFEYAGYITADCDGMAQSYLKPSKIKTGKPPPRKHLKGKMYKRPVVNGQN